jgi:hypothetical protein
MLSFFSLFLVVLSAAKAPQSKMVATEISEICQSYIRGDNSNRVSINQLRDEIVGKFEEGNETTIRELTIDTINQIENASYNTLNANDQVILQKIAIDILNMNFTLLMTILCKKSLQFNVFFLSLFDNDNKLTVYPPMLTGQSKGVGQIENNGLMDKHLNEVEFGRLADSSIEFLKMLRTKRFMRGDKDQIDILIRKLANETVKLIIARKSVNPQ